MNNVRKLSNFASGPAQLPIEILNEIQNKLLDIDGKGRSILEIGHHDKYYENIHFGALKRIKKILSVPDDFDILLLQGGARLQFSMVPLNLCSPNQKCSYILSGVWAEEAYKEASILRNTSIICRSDDNYTSLPQIKEKTFQNEKLSYVHITTNNTIYGTQFHNIPKLKNINLVADMTSELMTRKVDFKKFSLIYSSAQKNLGIAGLTIVILKKKFLNPNLELPPSLSYFYHSKLFSRLNTPPIFAIYCLDLMLQWIESNGGILQQEVFTKHKAQELYKCIDDSSGFYLGMASLLERSYTNITFKLKNSYLEEKFIKEAQEAKIIGIKGHYLVKGIRVANYLGTSTEDFLRLVEFMKSFQVRHS